MRRTYKIQPRPADLGGGWHLKLYENNQKAGGGIYPIQERAARRAGMVEWTSRNAARTGS